MLRLLLIADDLTGALDSGIKFAEKGLRTLVIPNPSALSAAEIPPETQVLAVNSDSRKLTPADAYKCIRSIGSFGLSWGADILFKKVDSALRGNVGSELAALVDLKKGESLCFAPAYPAMNRITSGGTHYINGTPLAQSVFAQDPFNPISTSFIPDLLSAQTSLVVHTIPNPSAIDRFSTDESGCIYLFDAVTDEDLQQIASQLHRMDKTSLLAGCAGFAEHIADLLSFHPAASPVLPTFHQGIVVCGSLNPITLGQIAYAHQHGAVILHLTAPQRGDPSYWDHPGGQNVISSIRSLAARAPVIVDTCGEPSGYPEDRTAIANSLGTLATRLIEQCPRALFLITGGDTLLGTVQQIPGATLEPICSVVEGAVLLRMSAPGHHAYIISKSGGFCEEDAISTIFCRLVVFSPPD